MSTVCEMTESELLEEHKTESMLRLIAQAEAENVEFDARRVSTLR